MFQFIRFTATLVVMLALAQSASALNYVLMLQQSPPQGGIVSPGIGVHNVEANGSVTVTAVPRPGYQFVYWLGDVSDTASASTTVSVNSPKIVVAVYQRSEYEQKFEPGVPLASGPERLIPASQPSYSHETSNQNYEYDPPDYPPYNPTPEPATMGLLAVGAIALLKRKKN